MSDEIKETRQQQFDRYLFTHVSEGEMSVEAAMHLRRTFNPNMPKWYYRLRAKYRQMLTSFWKPWSKLRFKP